ncbi:MAG: YihA family ribosome biogenesis GTP-binding protein [Acidobacteria bacterium]|nr:YihA family ribosome biogenesis GTP-binding protein [Acidobacteriota bacterium]MBI3757090.1 YihA family ribosome biogenesis GTP-binding protein [Deltaproteobacteria bacterium]
MKISPIYFVISAGRSSDFPKDGMPEIAFAGRSNIGKSSLINSLVSVKGLARTSQIPGKTQTINFFKAKESFYLVDLPGYGYANVPRRIRDQWQDLIESYLIGRDQLRLVVLIVDVRHSASAGDLQMKSWLQHNSVPFVIVATKADKLSNNQRKQAEKTLKLGFSADQIMMYSANTGIGREALWKTINLRLRSPMPAKDSASPTG